MDGREAPRFLPPPGESLVFACPHMSITNVTAASCGTCGPLVPVRAA